MGNKKLKPIFSNMELLIAKRKPKTKSSSEEEESADDDDIDEPGTPVHPAHMNKVTPRRNAQREETTGTRKKAKKRLSSSEEDESVDEEEKKAAAKIQQTIRSTRGTRRRPTFKSESDEEDFEKPAPPSEGKLK